MQNSREQQGEIKKKKKTFLSEQCKEIEGKNRIGKNKASGGYGIAAKLFKILKDAAALNMSANLENSAVATGLEKVSFHSNLKERQCR